MKKLSLPLPHLYYIYKDHANGQADMFNRVYKTKRYYVRSHAIRNSKGEIVAHHYTIHLHKENAK